MRDFLLRPKPKLDGCATFLHYPFYLVENMGSKQSIYSSNKLEEEISILEGRKHSINYRFRSSFHSTVMSAILDNIIYPIFIWHLILSCRYRLGY